MKKQQREELIKLNSIVSNASTEIGIMLELEEIRKEAQKENRENTKKLKYKFNINIDGKRTTVNLSKNLVNLYFYSKNGLKTKDDIKTIRKFIVKEIEKNEKRLLKEKNRTQIIEEIFYTELLKKIFFN